MKSRLFSLKLAALAVTTLISQNNVYAHAGEEHSDHPANATQRKIGKPASCQLLTADRVFDGTELHTGGYAVLIKKDKVSQIGTQASLKKKCSKKLNLGDATILPGFIESHAHISYQNVDHDTVLRHGVTTVRDVGGPIYAPMGGNGELRLLSSGPILQAENGYPLNVFGGDSGFDKVGLVVKTVSEAESAVASLVAQGASVIKISLELGGESGAPWMMKHGENPVPSAPWPMLSEEIVKAIVAKAESLNKTVSAHIGENTGAKLALDAGVHEWTHIPCAAIDNDLIRRAITDKVRVVSTIDTLGSCGSGLYANAMGLASKMADGTMIYGAEIAHDNVPWGIDGEELHLLLHLTSGGAIDFNKVVNVIKSATSTAGKDLGIDGLGTLNAGAPADVIAVRGNPFERFKLLEYPDLVISGGRVIVNNQNF